MGVRKVVNSLFGGPIIVNLKKAKEHPVLSIKVKIWCLFEQMLTNESACIKEIDVIQSENAYSKFTLIRLNAIMKIMRVRIDVEKFIAFTTTGVKGIENLVSKLFKSSPRSLEPVFSTVIERGDESDVIWKFIKKIKFDIRKKSLQALPLISLWHVADYCNLSIDNWSRLVENWESSTEILFLVMKKWPELSCDRSKMLEILVPLFERLDPTDSTFSGKKISS